MGTVVSVSARDGHGLGKDVREAITLIIGEGVEGDAHRGVTVKHRSRVAKDPTQPNLRQVHLVHAELFDEIAAQGFLVGSGNIGENILTRGIDLLGLPTGARLRIGADVVIEITGLRNPCHQLNGHQAGLMNALLDRDGAGNLIRKGGVMGIVLVGGIVQAGDVIEVVLPLSAKRPLLPV
jgi:MOSC domain-containing protein YiiM